MEENILNAKITSASFGYCEHGILTFEIHLKASDGNHYMFGGYALDEPISKNGKCYRIPTQKGFECLTETMKTIGTDHWDELEGKCVRIKVKDTRNFISISVIGNLLEDKWFDIDAFWKA
ncbi:MAG: hypothetical protein HPZ99_06495 [Oscillospiraceae bacterium]|nr:hypothetical protein [Oscillospiraceae bacterium]